MEPAISSDMTRETTEANCYPDRPVALTVDVMSNARLAYDDASTPAEMRIDCLAAQAALAGPLAATARELSREQPKVAQIEVPEAAARLARALHLQLDGE